MLRKVILWLLPILAVMTLLAFTYPVFSDVTSSPYKQFNVTPNVTYLNWTNGYASNLTLSINSVSNSNVTLQILNTTAFSTGNYSQVNSLPQLPSLCTGSNYVLLVRNESGQLYTSSQLLNGTSTTNSTNMTVFDPTFGLCLPGRYWTNNFAITNGTTENASVAVQIDVPISANNSINENLPTTGIGSFGGYSAALPINATTYHSYYFNTSEVSNATAVSVNLTGWPSNQLAQLFLFNDSGNLQAKSINRNTTQYLNFYPLPTQSAWWEIRVYGNSTSKIPYGGSLIFSTLNVTDASDTNQQVLNLNYGPMNVSTSSISNLFLINSGSLNLTNVALTNNTYRIQKFSGTGGSQNFSFLVGDHSIESKVRVGLHWTGGTNYTLNVYNPSGTLMATASNYYTLSNVTNASDEELVAESTTISPGYWTASIVSNNAGSDPFNLNVSTFEAQSFISTNYTSPSSFNGLNSNQAIYVNITIPSKTIDGVYQGALYFTDQNGGGVNIPIFFNVTTPTLLVLNGSNSPTFLNPFNATDGSNTFRLDEDYGSNVVRTVSFNLTNIGTFDQAIDMTTNSINLTNSTGGVINFNYTTVNYVANHTSQLFQVNYTINSLARGTYFGWIFINASNTTITNTSHPYSGYNLTLELNLTNLLSVTIPRIKGTNNNYAYGLGSTSSESDIVSVNVTYVNGISINDLTVSNFTDVWIQEGNVTSSLGKIDVASSLVNGSGNGTGLVYCTSSCSPGIPQANNLNFTLPQNEPGGQYTINAQVLYNRNDGLSFQGQGSNSSYIINNTGLFMSTSNLGCSLGSTCSSGAITLGPGSSQVVDVQVPNYGPVAAPSATLSISQSCAGITFSQGTSSGCTSASLSGLNYSLSIPQYNTSCVAEFVVSAISTASSSSCSESMVGGGATWFDPSGINFTITITNSTSPSSPGSNSVGNLPSSSAPVYISFTSYPSIIYIVQGSTNSTTVVVKNVNDSKTQDIGFSIANLTSSWFSITPSIRTAILPYSSTNFSVSFNAPSSAAVQDYLAKFVATSNYANATQAFTVRVLPSENSKAVINQTYQLYLLNYTELSAEVNSTKGNTTLAQEDLTLAKAQLDQAQTYINSGDYFSAQQALNQAKDLLAKVTSDLSATSNPLTNLLAIIPTNWQLYAAISAGAVIAVVVAYLFWPSKKEAKSAVFKPKTQAPISTTPDSTWQKLKEKWSWENLKSKWKKTT